MPNFNDRIEHFGAGDDLAVQRTIDAISIPAGQVITIAWMYVKRELIDADVDAIFFKRITSTANADGQILANGTGGTNATVLFALTRTNTALLTQPHWFEIKVQTTDTKQYSSNRGYIRGESSVIGQAT